MRVLLGPHCPSLRVSAVFCHVSDYAKGFGGKYGVQKDRMDKVSPQTQALWFLRTGQVHGLGHLAVP